MGLPLFVAPVESDLPSKATSKSVITVEHRANARRPGRSEIRDRQSSVRQPRVRVYNPAQRTLPTTARERFLPWVESTYNRGTSGSNDSAFRQALREVTGDPTNPLGDNFRSMFGLNWTESPSISHRENMSEGVDLDWTSTEAALNNPPRNSAVTDSRLAGLRLFGADQSSNPSQSRSEHPPFWSRSTALDGAENTDAASEGLPAFMGRYSSVPSPTHQHEMPRPNRRRTPSPVVRSLSARQAMVPGRRYAVALDGLGDRERSLSPEVWDTLLSTLAPDPQAPSVGSSFSSVGGRHSRSSGPSSTTPPSAPDLTEEMTAGEPPCESGCENSDAEDGGDYGHPNYGRTRRRREEVDAAVPTSAPPRTANGSANRTNTSRSAGIPDSRRTARQVRTANGPLTIYESTGSLGQSTRSGRVARGTRTRGNNAGQRTSWLSHLVQDGDSNSGMNRSNPMASEDDWAGMQRIVRSLARREDIPEEWWAEAGLSRTLEQSDPPGGNDTNVSQSQ